MRLFLCIVFCLSGFFTFSQLPANMFGDTTHAPFYHGVTSGDPLANQVIIWTKITSSASSEKVFWELSVYPDFSWINQKDSLIVDSSTDFTVKIDVTGLSPSTIYYYRFKNSLGHTSAIGTTRTSPLSTDILYHMRFAVVSCSSIYSGFFNGYKRISERNDIDFVMHLGDYIYDFVDADEEVRVPTPYPSVPTNLQEWRDRHSYYLLDPDLRAARQKHAWIAIWDNHDLSNIGDPDFIASQQAFYEYLPVRVPDPTDSSKLWRKFSYGALMEIFMIDMYTKKDIDLITPTEYHILGLEQNYWLKTELTSSTARWKIVGNQKMVAGWSVIGLPSWFPGDGTYLTTSSWDGWDVARDELLLFLKDNGINNVVFMSGDSHVTLVADLSEDPYDPGTYSGSTGSGSIACEFLPTSLTRGNFDEMGISSSLLPLATGLSNAANPNHVHSEFVSHGYGIVDVSPDTLIAEIWYSDKLNQTSSEIFNEGYYVLNGMNHWERGTLNTPSLPKDTIYLLSTTDINHGQMVAFPIPATNQIHLIMKEPLTNQNPFQKIQVYNVSSGKLITTYEIGEPTYSTTLDVSDLSYGSFILVAFDSRNKKVGSFQFIKMRH